MLCKVLTLCDSENFELQNMATQFKLIYAKSREFIRRLLEGCTNARVKISLDSEMELGLDALSQTGPKSPLVLL